MPNFYRSGIVALTLAVKHACRLLIKFGPAIDAKITAATVSTAISPAQAATLRAFLASVSVACDILRAVSGY